MTTPFDEAIEWIKAEGYHNHRKDAHSNIVSKGIFRDLQVRCPRLKEDVESDKVQCWLNIPAPGGRHREIDMFIGEPDASGKPNLARARICVENKSVVTAHRNVDARYDDLDETVKAIQSANREAICCATILVGVASRYLNIPDVVKKVAGEVVFESSIRSRLSKGDGRLWDEFKYGISPNKSRDPERTIKKFRTLPVRGPGDAKDIGYDFIILVPVSIDNVNPPELPRPNILGIDVDTEYDAMLDQLSMEYETRWP